MLPDRSFLKGKNWWKMPKLKIQMRHFGRFFNNIKNIEIFDNLYCFPGKDFGAVFSSPEKKPKILQSKPSWFYPEDSLWIAPNPRPNNRNWAKKNASICSESSLLKLMCVPKVDEIREIRSVMIYATD